MENYFQRIVAYLLSILLFFVFPIYISYEKKDDLSHAMASKIVHLFVDTVRNKGYVAPTMYEDLNEMLRSTGNSYDIQMEHTKKRYDPVVYIYGVKDGKVVIVDEMTDVYYKENVKGQDKFSYRGKQYDKYLSLENGKYISTEIPGKTIETIKRTAKASNEIFSNQMIVNKLYPDYMYEVMKEDNTTLEVPSKESDVRKYLLSVGDNFRVSVRNKNTTLATVIFYTITSQRQQYGVPKIYISYGGTVRNELIKEVITASSGTPNEGEEFPDIDDTIISDSTDRPAHVSTLEIGQHKEFNCTETTEIFKLTRGVYRIEAWGASGGGVKNNSNVSGGRGGYVEGVIEITDESRLLDIRVGGKGQDAGSGNSGTISKLNSNGGYNGGGNGSGIGGAGGGGATEIRLGGEGLENRIMVAAGGGGNTLSAEFSQKADGGLDHAEHMNISNGEDGCIDLHVPPYGNDECGGGAGLYGGKTVHGDDAKYAFGGTNYINTSFFQNHNMSAGIQTGDGKVVITRLR